MLHKRNGSSRGECTIDLEVTRMGISRTLRGLLRCGLLRCGLRLGRRPLSSENPKSSGEMKDPTAFDALVRLNKAAEKCCGNTMGFIEHYRQPFQFSSDSHTAAMQARQRLGRLDPFIEKAQGHIEEWWDADPRGEAIDYIRNCVGMDAKPYFIDRQSYLTAHEAARAMTEHLVSLLIELPDGENDIETWRNVERTLQDMEFHDLNALLEREYQEASKLTPSEFDDPDLTLVVEQWHSLSADARADIVERVKAAIEPDREETED